MMTIFTLCVKNTFKKEFKKKTINLDSVGK